MSDLQKTRVLREIEPEWDRLMQLAKKIDYGKAEIIFQNGKPVRLDMVVKQIKLDIKEQKEDKLDVTLL